MGQVPEIKLMMIITIIIINVFNSFSSIDPEV